MWLVFVVGFWLLVVVLLGFFLGGGGIRGKWVVQYPFTDIVCIVN